MEKGWRGHASCSVVSSTLFQVHLFFQIGSVGAFAPCKLALYICKLKSLSLILVASALPLLFNLGTPCQSVPSNLFWTNTQFLDHNAGTVSSILPAEV
jgi:hypothetical protein